MKHFGKWRASVTHPDCHFLLFLSSVFPDLLLSRSHSALFKLLCGHEDG